MPVRVIMVVIVIVTVILVVLVRMRMVVPIFPTLFVLMRILRHHVNNRESLNLCGSGIRLR
jgi:hypothetical protein